MPIIENVKRDIEEITILMRDLKPNTLEYWKFMLLKRQFQLEYKKYLRERKAHGKL